MKSSGRKVAFFKSNAILFPRILPNGISIQKIFSNLNSIGAFWPLKMNNSKSANF